MVVYVGPSGVIRVWATCGPDGFKLGSGYVKDLVSPHSPYMSMVLYCRGSLKG